jgi:four helix bundle protein
MTYTQWVKTVPQEIQEDALWKQEIYRLALFAADLACHDVTKLFRDGRTIKLAAQLFDAVGSIGADISEGYSRGHQKDRARFYEYALGSARESRTWYFDARHALGEPVALHRIRLHTQSIRLLLSMLPSTRGYTLHEGDTSEALLMADDDDDVNRTDLVDLLKKVPLSEL